MIDMNTMVQELTLFAQEVKLLYIEDNKGLRENIISLLTKFFPYLYYAENGEIGYERYRQYNPDIVLSDIKMPGMSGFELAKAIKLDNSDIRIIFLSAFDEKEYLYEAIENGAFRYLAKPTKIPLLISALHAAVLSIHNDRNKRIFERQLNDIFNYQNNLLMMFDKGIPILVNRQFLDFFGVKNLDEFMQQREGIRELLLEHQGFLYSTSESGWYEKALANSEQLFHTKVVNYDKETRHLIMKLRKIPDKEGMTIVSFDDISELNLMMIFDGNATKNDQKFQESNAVMKLMNVIKENGSEVKLHNFYRGLTIVNSAVLVNIDNNKIVLKTAYAQLKAIKIAKNITITSELFPYSVLCKVPHSIDFDQQTISFSDMQFIQESADQRANIRLEPDEGRHSATLFYDEIKFSGRTRVVDISICSVKIEIDALPAGLCIGTMSKISMIFETDHAPLLLMIQGKVHRIDTFAKSFNVVYLFTLSPVDKEKVRNYIANRQMELIREFKAL